MSSLLGLEVNSIDALVSFFIFLITIVMQGTESKIFKQDFICYSLLMVVLSTSPLMS